MINTPFFSCNLSSNTPNQKKTWLHAEGLLLRRKAIEVFPPLSNSTPPKVPLEQDRLPMNGKRCKPLRINSCSLVLPPFFSNSPFPLANSVQVPLQDFAIDSIPSSNEWQPSKGIDTRYILIQNTALPFFFRFSPKYRLTVALIEAFMYLRWYDFSPFFSCFCFFLPATFPLVLR